MTNSTKALIYLHGIKVGLKKDFSNNTFKLIGSTDAMAAAVERTLITQKQATKTKTKEIIKQILHCKIIDNGDGTNTYI